MSSIVNDIKNSKHNAYCVLRKITNYGLRIYLVAGVVILLLIAITACNSSANAEPTPPEIHYGEDICEFCGMIISEERFAAGYITQDGEEYIFDDIVEMVQAYLQNEDEIIAVFVHDYETHTWVPAEKAYYAQSDDLATPMLSGLAAFSTMDQAQAFANDVEGQVFSYDELLTYYQENPPGPAFSGLSEN